MDHITNRDRNKDAERRRMPKHNRNLGQLVANALAKRAKRKARS